MRENLTNLKGARKTMPSARKSVSNSDFSLIRKIDPSTSNSEVRTPVHLIPNEPNLRFFVVNTLSNSTLDNTTELNFKATEKISADLEENLSKSISEQRPNRFTPVSFNVESRGINNYGKRLAESMHSSDISSRNKALKVIEKIRKYPLEPSHNFPILGEKFENIHQKHLKEKLSRTVLSTSQNGMCSGQESNKTSDNTVSFQIPQKLRETNEKLVKHGKILEKEGQHAMQMKTAPSESSANFAFYKTPCHKFRGTHFPRILIRHDIKGSSSRVPASTNVPVVPTKAESISRLKLEKNNSRLDDLMGCVPGVAPVRYSLPPAHMAFSDQALFLHRNFSAHSSAKKGFSRRMIGTATRGIYQNAESSKLVYPSPLHSLQNYRFPIVSVTGTNPIGTETCKFYGSANVCDSHRLFPATCSQELATVSRLDMDGSKRDTARKQSVIEGNFKTGRDSDILQLVNRKEDPKKGEDKILNTRRMLDSISELLKGINEELSGEFECNGLELSLPIWKKELEQCILSVEKIKKTLDHREKK